MLMEDAASTAETLRRLKALGVRVAIDDFGTGYSSLSYLRRFAVDTLKIDRSFVTAPQGDRGTDAIVRAVMTLGESLGLGVTAEGIETSEHLALVRSVGCRTGQGLLPLAAGAQRGDVAATGAWPDPGNRVARVPRRLTRRCSLSLWERAKVRASTASPTSQESGASLPDADQPEQAEHRAEAEQVAQAAGPQLPRCAPGPVRCVFPLQRDHPVLTPRSGRRGCTSRAGVSEHGDPIPTPPRLSSRCGEGAV